MTLLSRPAAQCPVAPAGRGPGLAVERVARTRRLAQLGRRAAYLATLSRGARRPGRPRPDVAGPNHLHTRRDELEGRSGQPERVRRCRQQSPVGALPAPDEVAMNGPARGVVDRPLGNPSPGSMAPSEYRWSARGVAPAVACQDRIRTAARPPSGRGALSVGRVAHGPGANGARPTRPASRGSAPAPTTPMLRLGAEAVTSALYPRSLRGIRHGTGLRAIDMGPREPLEPHWSRPARVSGRISGHSTQAPER
jgi:hypothetical protein